MDISKLNPLNRGLTSQIVFSFILTVIIILNIAGWFFYSRARQYFDTELGKTLVSVAETGANLTDTELLEFLQPGYEGGEFYNELLSNFQVIKKAFKVERIFVLDKNSRILLDTDTDSRIGEQPAHIQINMLEIASTLQGKTVYSTLYRGKNDNLYKSGYAPLTDQNMEVVAVIGVDASPAFLQIIDRIGNLIIVLNVISITSAVLISIGLAKSILRPVRQLVGAAQRISRGKLDELVVVKSRNEIGFLAEVFNSMQENIKDSERNLKRLKDQAEGKAESIQAYNNYILESIENGILTCDLEGRLTIINPAAEKILNLQRENSIGKRYADVFEPKHSLRNLIDKNISNSVKRQSDVEVILPDNKKLSVDVSPLLDSTKNTIGLNLVITDMTEIMELRQRIKERERLAYLGELSATVAHEVRNPLNSIELFVGLLKERIKSKPEREDAIQKIQTEIKTLNLFITNFLMFSKPQKIEPANVSVDKLIQEVMFLAWKELQDKSIDVNINMGDKNLTVNGDFEQLKRALLNIVLNAVQAMEKSGSLAISAKSMKRSVHSVELILADSGRGIERSEREKIFQPFYSTRSQGTGLGLAIVQSIIQGHNGTVVVEDNKPVGTKFVVRI